MPCCQHGRTEHREVQHASMVMLVAFCPSEEPSDNSLSWQGCQQHSRDRGKAAEVLLLMAVWSLPCFCVHIAREEDKQSTAGQMLSGFFIFHTTFDTEAILFFLLTPIPSPLCLYLCLHTHTDANTLLLPTIPTCLYPAHGTGTPFLFHLLCHIPCPSVTHLWTHPGASCSSSQAYILLSYCSSYSIICVHIPTQFRL